MKLAHWIAFVILLAPAALWAQNGQMGIRPVGGDGFHGQRPGSLIVRTENGSPFFLVVNGIRRNDEPRQRVVARGLTPFNNNIEIQFVDNMTPPIRRQINLVDPIEGEPVELSLVIVLDRDGRPRLKFEQSTNMERAQGAENVDGDRGGMARRDYDRNQGQMAPAAPPPPTPMDPNSFNEARNTINSSNFDDNKLSTAKTIFSTNYLTVDQVIQVCQLFGFDDRKLDFAKFAYSRTVDANNYFRVTTVFTFDSNKEELNRFLRSQQH